MLMKMSNWLWMSLFTILYTCFFLKVTVKAVIKFDNKLLFASPSTASSISGTQTGLPATPLFSPSRLSGTLYAF